LYAHVRHALGQCRSSNLAGWEGLAALHSLYFYLQSGGVALLRAADRLQVGAMQALDSKRDSKLAYHSSWMLMSDTLWGSIVYRTSLVGKAWLLFML
jgi:quinol-cytochrome oxidoreductase complex cytochrome b subunit